MTTIRDLLLFYAAYKRGKGDLVWRTKTAEYFWATTGGPLRHPDVIENLNAYNDHMSVTVRDMAEALGEGGDLGRWQDQMRDIIRDSHRVSYMAGRGGRDVMTAGDWGSVGGHINFELRYLDNFAQEIAAGNLTPGQIAARADMYARASHKTFEKGYRNGKYAAGYMEERRRSAGDDKVCGDCAQYEAMGWQAIGTLPAPGEQCACLSNCRCDFEFRGQVAPLMTMEHIERMMGMPEGFTYHPATGTFPTEGLAFSIWPERTKRYEAGTAEWSAFRDYVRRNRDLMVGPMDIPRHRRYLGGWVAHGDLWFDVSAVLPQDQFWRVVELCHNHDQEGFYDIGKGKYESTEEWWRKLEERRSRTYKKNEPGKLTLIPVSEIPEDLDSPEFEAFAKKMINHFRALAGLEPAYDEDGNEIPGRINRD